MKGNTLQLTLGTGAFAVCFAVFGTLSAMMPLLRKSLALDPLQVSVAIAVPVLLGSLLRIPLGIMTDRYGGRRVFAVVMACTIVPALLLGTATSYAQLIVYGLFVGIGLASFSVGVGFVSRWYPAAAQGKALGIYGAGNAGQSLAAFGAPMLAAAIGIAMSFRVFAVLAFVWLVIWLMKAEDAPVSAVPKRLGESLAPLREGDSWVLSLYYFLTFGGFVAMSVYLPTFLTEMFGLTPQDAGLRTAGFAALATALRPIGGTLADRIGGRRILIWVFPGTAAMAIFMACPLISTFTIGALGMAALIGLGNGAVFKLVPEYFPKNVGAVTGLVGAAGGLGGFFPPLVLGVVRRQTGAYTLGFIFLAVFTLLCLGVLMWRSRRVGSP